MHIRDFNDHTDVEGLKACVIELQDYERRLDQRMPSGAQIVDAYVPEMLKRCAKYHGKILVADQDEEIAGYATVWTKFQSEEIEDGDMECGVVADLVVREGFRNRGIGRELLIAAEKQVIAAGVRRLRIGVLAQNRVARQLYKSFGFSDYLLQLEKELTGPGG